MPKLLRRAFTIPGTLADDVGSALALLALCGFAFLVAGL